MFKRDKNIYKWGPHSSRLGWIKERGSKGKESHKERKTDNKILCFEFKWKRWKIGYKKWKIGDNQWLKKAAHWEMFFKGGSGKLGDCYIHGKIQANQPEGIYLTANK